jgi:hypothetical protein
MFIMKYPMSLQSRDIQQLLGKFVFNWRGKVFRAAAARDFTAKGVLDTDRLLLCSRHFATRSPLAAAARNTFPRQLQTNFESFPNNCCISRDCRLTGYFIMNMWKCYLLFELHCTIMGQVLFIDTDSVLIWA